MASRFGLYGLRFRVGSQVLDAVAGSVGNGQSLETVDTFVEGLDLSSEVLHDFSTLRDQKH